MKRVAQAILLVIPVIGICQDQVVVPADSELGELIEQMDRDEERRAEELRQTSLVSMSLSDMFEDENVRRLARAAGRGDIDTIERLVGEGVDVNARGAHGVTPLFWALQSLDGFTRLLELGANPNVVYEDEERTSVMHAAINFDIDVRFLRAALDHGGDPDFRGQYTNDPLIFDAVNSGDQEALKLLIEAGANLNARSGFFQVTPMMAGISLARYESIYTLLIHGADYTLRDSTGLSIVDLIAMDRPRLDKNTEQWNWMLKVSDWLEDRGMPIPLVPAVPQLPDR